MPQRLLLTDKVTLFLSNHRSRHVFVLEVKDLDFKTYRKKSCANYLCSRTSAFHLLKLWKNFPIIFYGIIVRYPCLSKGIGPWKIRVEEKGLVSRHGCLRRLLCFKTQRKTCFIPGPTGVVVARHFYKFQSHSTELHSFWYISALDWKDSKFSTDRKSCHRKPHIRKCKTSKSTGAYQYPSFWSQDLRTSKILTCIQRRWNCPQNESISKVHFRWNNSF